MALRASSVKHKPDHTGFSILPISGFTRAKESGLKILESQQSDTQTLQLNLPIRAVVQFKFSLIFSSKPVPGQLYQLYPELSDHKSPGA